MPVLCVYGRPPDCPHWYKTPKPQIYEDRQVPSRELYPRWMRRYRQDAGLRSIWGDFPAFRRACTTRNRHLASEEAYIATVQRDDKRTRWRSELVIR